MPCASAPTLAPGPAFHSLRDKSPCRRRSRAAPRTTEPLPRRVGGLVGSAGTEGRGRAGAARPPPGAVGTARSGPPPAPPAATASSGAGGAVPRGPVCLTALPHCLVPPFPWTLSASDASPVPPSPCLLRVLSEALPRQCTAGGRGGAERPRRLEPACCSCLGAVTVGSLCRSALPDAGRRSPFIRTGRALPCPAGRSNSWLGPWQRMPRLGPVVKLRCCCAPLLTLPLADPR